MKRFVLVGALSTVLVLSFTGCMHRHTWIDANCITPKTCSECGATEGNPLGDEGHDWKAASCAEPKTCSICGKTDGQALGHKWEDQTYSKPKTCSRCGATEGKSLEEETNDTINDLKKELGQTGDRKRYHITVRPS